MKKDILTRPFPPELVKQRQGQGGKTLNYVETHAVIARLNEGCDAWNFEIVEHQILDEEVVVIGKLTADGVTKMAFGGSSITRDREGRPVSIADDAKADRSFPRS
jgi:recombination DNA repair RAD52 pathway protein